MKTKAQEQSKAAPKVETKLDVRSTSHRLHYANTGKLSTYSDLLSDCRKIINERIDYIWGHRFEVPMCNGKTKVFDISEERLELPRFLSKGQLVDIESVDGRSARLDKCCTTQAIGIVKAAVEKQRMRKWVMEHSNGDTHKVREKYEKTGFTKPVPVALNIEVNSTVAEFIRFDEDDENHHHFSGFLHFSSLGDDYEEIYLPIKLNKRDRYWESRGYKMSKSFLLCDGEVWFRWRKEVPLRTEGTIIGSDQGVKDTLYLSNGKKTPVANKQGITMDSILTKMARKEKGSKAFKRAACERDNFMRWQLNRLCADGGFTGVRQLNHERIWNLNYRRRTSRKMSHWSYPIIDRKLESLLLEHGVRFLEEGSTYMSQRCSRCGLVKKSNRKKKVYKCSHCGLEIDSDLNAALNHTQDLPPIDWTLRVKQMNRKGFFWLKTGLFTLDGGEPISPPSPVPVPRDESHDSD